MVNWVEIGNVSTSSHGSAAAFSMEYFHSMASRATKDTLWFLQMLALCATVRVQLCS